MDFAVVPLTHEHIVAMAREQARSRVPMEHHFEAGSREARMFERAYLELQRELEENEG